LSEKNLKPGWRRVKFGDVVRLSKARSKDPMADGIERYVGLEHLEPGDLRIRSWGSVADGVTFTSVFQPGQVLFGKRRAYQRKVAVADFSGVCSGDIYVLETKDAQVLLPELLPFICQTDAFFDHAVGTSAGSLSPRTNWTSLADFEFALPPIEEQSRLIKALTAARESIEAYRALELSIDRLLKAELDVLLHQNTIKQLYEGKEAKLPKGWKVATLGDVLNRITYGFTNPMPTTDEGPWMVTAKDVANGSVNFETARRTSLKAYKELLTDKSRPNIGDVLITKDGTLGRVGVVETDNLCINQSVALLQPNDLIRSRFLAWSLQAPTMQWRLLQDAGGSAIKHLYITKIAETKFALPPIETQDTVLEIIESSSDAIKKIGTRRTELTRKLGLMLESMGGEHGVH
jgi:type I restriction enzyme S subunit